MEIYASAKNDSIQEKEAISINLDYKQLISKKEMKTYKVLKGPCILPIQIQNTFCQKTKIQSSLENMLDRTHARKYAHAIAHMCYTINTIDLRYIENFIIGNEQQITPPIKEIAMSFYYENLINPTQPHISNDKKYLLSIILNIAQNEKSTIVLCSEWNNQLTLEDATSYASVVAHLLTSRKDAILDFGLLESWIRRFNKKYPKKLTVH